jgi:hypothetical protein
VKQKGASPGRSRAPVRAAICAALLAFTITGATATSASAISLPPFLQRLLHPRATPTPAPATGAQKPDVGASPSPSPGQQAMPVNRGNTAVLSSDSLAVTNLRSIAVTTVAASAGTVKVIQLRADASTIRGLDLLGPCSNGVMIHVTGTQQVASGGLTINSTALQLTVLGTRVTLNASSLPTTPTLTLPGVSLPALPTNTAFLSVKMDVALVSSESTTITGLHQTGIPC